MQTTIWSSRRKRNDPNGRYISHWMIPLGFVRPELPEGISGWAGVGATLWQRLAADVHSIDRPSAFYPPSPRSHSSIPSAPLLPRYVVSSCLLVICSGHVHLYNEKNETEKKSRRHAAGTERPRGVRTHVLSSGSTVSFCCLLSFKFKHNQQKHKYSYNPYNKF